MPLAHIIAPQLVRKTEEIAQALDPAPLQNVGYLQQGGGEKRYDPTTPLGAAVNAIGTMQRSGDEGQQALAQGFQSGLNAPQAAPIAPYLQHEPQQEPVLVGARPGPIVLDKGELQQLAAAGELANDAGHPVDARGRQTSRGYLKQRGDARTLERKDTDVGFDDLDTFGSQALEQMYGKYLKDAEDAYKPGQRDAFPDGYFAGMSKGVERNIRAGVRELQRRAKQKL